MKLFLLGVLCFGLALAVPNESGNPKQYPTIQEISYRPGKEYVYNYDTQIMTGLPKASQLQAGFRLNCKAYVQFQTATKVAVQFDKVILYRINEPVVQWKASETLIPEEFLKELVGEEANTMERFLVQPFGFEYDDGEVKKIHLADQETTWSANLKRGFTALFEMNLEKRYILQESFPAIKSQVPPHANWYNVLERSPTGDCVTLYTVTPNSQNNQRYVTKVRNYDQCLDKPIYLNSIVTGYYTQDARKDNPLINGATVKYSVKGGDKKFIILSAVGESHIVFTPYKHEEHVRTSLNQTLVLQESKFIGREVQQIPEVQQGKHKKTTIKMTLPSSPVDCQDPFMPCKQEPKQINEEADVYSVQKIHLHLRLAATNTEQLTDEEGLQHMRVVKDMLKRSPQKILKDLWDKLYINKVNPQAEVDRLSRQIYWNVLPNVGTEASANVILDICATDFLMNNNCTSALNGLALRNTPTTKLIHKLIQLTKIGRLTPQVRQAAYLALGSFGHKLTKHLEKSDKQCEKALNLIKNVEQNSNSAKNDFDVEKSIVERCNSIQNQYQQSEERIIDAIHKLLESNKEKDKLLALKALGNSGLPRSMPTLQKYLDNVQEPKMLRLTAVMGFRRIYYPLAAKQEAVERLLKVYLTTTEKNEIRSMVFLILSGLNPEKPVLETVAKSLRNEKDSQVSAIVYRYLTSYSNSTYGPDKFIKQNCTAALKHSPEIHAGLEHSYWKKIGHYSQDYKRGQAASIAVVGDIARYLGVAVTWESYNYGLVSNPLEIGVNTEALSPFLNKLFGPHGLLTENKSLFDLLKRAPRDVSPQEQIRQIFRQLRIEPRTMPVPEGHIYVKMMGDELRYLDFSQSLQQILATGAIPVNFDEEELKVGIPVSVKTMYDLSDYQVTFPTEAGLPVSLKSKVLTNLDVQGNLTFKVSPYMLQSDRQGQPPVTVSAKVDLQPKVVAEVEASMGLDSFYVKPVVGYRGLVKYHYPIQREVSVDLAYKRVNLKVDMPMAGDSSPALEMLLEPFSQFTLITASNQSPVQMSFRRSLFAPFGNRMQPISYNWKINLLGYRLAMTGQLPRDVHKNNYIHPLSGRSLLNVYWLPLKDAPKSLQIRAQYLVPQQKDVSDTYAQAYQSQQTSEPQEFGRDFSNMPETGAREYDRNRRPLPQSPEERLPYVDPIDIEKQPLTMQRLCNKFQKVFSKPMPFNRESARGLVIQIEASSEQAKRQVQLESVWRSVKDGRAANLYARVWRSPIPNYDNRTWQMLTEMGVTYPFQVIEPKDIFSAQWQRQLMKDLQYLISMESHKIANQQINMTIMSTLEQMNYPSMVRSSTERIMGALVPEQLYQLKNITGSTIYNRCWDNYWRYLLPVEQQIAQEVRINVDPNIVNQDLSMLEHLTKVLKVQSKFQKDLRDILDKAIMAHAELPILQIVNFYQSKSVNNLREIYIKAKVNGRLHQTAKIQHMLKMAERNLETIQILVQQVFQRVTTVSQRLDEDGKPAVVFKPEVLRKTSRQAELLYNFKKYQMAQQQYYPQEDEYYQRQQPQQQEQPSYFTNENRQQRQEIQPEDFYDLRMALYNLSLIQVDLNENIQMAISKKIQIDQEQVNRCIQHARDTLNIIDQQLKKRFVVDPIAKQSILLVTVQNQINIQLLEQWKIQVSDKVNLPQLSRKLEVIKEQGTYFGERAAFLYHQGLMQRVVVPLLNREEFPIYKQIRKTKRQALPELREFQIYLAYNFTNMKKPEVIDAVCHQFEQQLEKHLNDLSNVEKALVQLDQVPQLYIMSELMDVLHYMKYSTEFGSRSLYSLKTPVRYSHLEKLGKTATKVQTLISALSPIFAKYEQPNNSTSQPLIAILNTIPIDTRVLDVQDVMVQQKMLKQQLWRFIRNPDLSVEVLDQVLSSVTDRLENLQEILKQNEVQVQSALEQRNSFERLAISAVWTQSLNQQRNLYEALLAIYKNNRDNIRDVSRKLERINALEEQTTELENAHDAAINNAKKNQQNEYQNDYNTDYSSNQQSQKYLQPLTPFEYLPTGVTAVVNTTWGNDHVLNKNAKAQFMAMRSVEQILYLFKQMQAVVRSQDIMWGINYDLSGQNWLTDSAMQKLNTYNHWHLLAQAHKEQLPQYLLDQLQYAQNWLKATFWNQYQRQHTETPKEILFQAMMDVSEFNKEVDLYLTQKKEANVYQGIPISRLASHFPVIQNYKPVDEKIESWLTFGQVPVKCEVNKEKIHTFDKVSLQLPNYLAKKEALLAADCSDDKSFVVTMQKSNSSLNGHVVKILNDDKRVVIIPRYLDTEVRVNGEVVVLKDHVPSISYKSLHYNKHQAYLKIVRKGLKVEIDFPMTGLKVIMQGSYVQVRVSPLFKRKMCGLCSNFDGQMSWELEGPTKEIYSSPRLFAQSYILRQQDRHSYYPHHPDFQVQNDRYTDVVTQYYKPKGDAGKYTDDIDEIVNKMPESVKHHHCSQSNGQQQTTESPRPTPGQGQQCRPRPATYKIGNKSKTCFSIQPVDACPPGCHKVVEKTKVKIQAVCFSNKNSQQIAKLSREASQGPLQNLQSAKGGSKRRINAKKHIACRP